MNKIALIIILIFLPFVSFTQTEEEIIPITRTEPIYPSAMLIDWNSEYLIKAKECGIELLKVVPMPCDVDYDYENENLPNPLVRDFKGYEINIQDGILSVLITLDQNCCSGFVAGIRYFEKAKKELDIELYGYGQDCECLCCFSFDFKIKVPEDFKVEEYDIDLSLSFATLDLNKKE